MASFVRQTFELTGIRVALDSEGVEIFYKDHGNEDLAYFDPKTRNDANQMCIVLKLAAAHLEKLGKGLK